MRRALTFSILSMVLVLAATTGAAPGQQAAQQGQQPAFRSGIIVVPIDVRVIDNKTGKPVEDLTQADFTLIEDGNVQPIRLFEKHNLQPEAVTPGTRIPIRESAFGAPEQHNRIFLIVLGYGKHNRTTGKPLEALTNFVRTQLLPQDQVGVFAYDRATDFTTEHEEIARLIERFSRMHYDIDMEVSLQVTSGLAGIYGSHQLPKKTQDKIDMMFQGNGDVASQVIGRGETDATKRAAADSRNAAAALQRADTNQKLTDMNAAAAGPAGSPSGPTGGIPTWSSLEEVNSQMFTTLTLDEFMDNNAQSLQDLGNCYAGIEYMRHLEGEKHLIFVTEKGMSLPRVDDDKDLARAANDARVAIHTLETGGILGQNGGNLQTGQNFNEAFAFQTLRTIAELTGGTSSIAEYGQVAIDRINAATRTDYTLGYYPSMASLNGDYKKIEVKVKRPDSTVLYRHGYFARRDIGSFNRRDFITQQRLQAATAYSHEIKDIKLKLDAGLDRNQLAIKLTIDPSKLAITVDPQTGHHVGSIDILVVAADKDGNVRSQNYQRAGLDFTEEIYQKLVKGGIPYSARIETNPGVRQVRVIVYDYKADLVGRVDAQVF